jgi:ABC-type glutathione transport system ATPase component
MRVCSILFLDEPTTGLDASTSMNVLRILKRLSLVNFAYSVLHITALESLVSLSRKDARLSSRFISHKPRSSVRRALHMRGLRVS